MDNIGVASTHAGRRQSARIGGSRLLTFAQAGRGDLEK